MQLTHYLYMIFLTAGVGWSQAGSLSGSIRDDAGRPLEGITVFYNSVSSEGTMGEGVPRPAIVKSTNTGADGAFTITGLAPGRYHLCGVPSSAGMIPSCRAGARPSVVSLAPDQNISDLSLVVTIGWVVRVRVLDSTRKIGRGERFRLGALWPNGSYVPAREIGFADQAHDYELTIPKAGASHLLVDTKLRVSDVNGALVPSRGAATALTGPGEVSLVVK